MRETVLLPPHFMERRNLRNSHGCFFKRDAKLRIIKDRKDSCNFSSTLKRTTHMEDIEITYRKGNIKEALQLSLKYLQQNQNSQDGEKIVLLEGYKWLQKCLIHYHKFTEETVLTILTQQEYLELWNKVLEVHGYRHASIEQDILLNQCVPFLI